MASLVQLLSRLNKLKRDKLKNNSVIHFFLVIISKFTVSFDFMIYITGTDMVLKPEMYLFMDKPFILMLRIIAGQKLELFKPQFQNVIHGYDLKAAQPA